jgi:hypothetical protein
MLNSGYQFTTCNLVNSNMSQVGSCILITALRENGMKSFVGI